MVKNGMMHAMKTNRSAPYRKYKPSILHRFFLNLLIVSFRSPVTDEKSFECSKMDRSDLRFPIERGRVERLFSRSDRYLSDFKFPMLSGSCLSWFESK